MCPFCRYGHGRHGGLFEIVTMLEITQEEWDRLREDGHPYPTEQTKFVCGAGKDCSIPETYGLAYRALHAYQSEPRYGG